MRSAENTCERIASTSCIKLAAAALTQLARVLTSIATPSPA
jgi:hypothetical protein